MKQIIRTSKTWAIDKQIFLNPSGMIYTDCQNENASNYIFKLSPILKDKKTITKTQVKNSALENNLSWFHV